MQNTIIRPQVTSKEVNHILNDVLQGKIIEKYKERYTKANEDYGSNGERVVAFLFFSFIAILVLIFTGVCSDTWNHWWVYVSAGFLLVSAICVPIFWIATNKAHKELEAVKQDMRKIFKVFDPTDDFILTVYGISSVFSQEYKMTELFSYLSGIEALEQHKVPPCENAISSFRLFKFVVVKDKHPENKILLQTYINDCFYDEFSVPCIGVDEFARASVLDFSYIDDRWQSLMTKINEVMSLLKD